MMNLDEKDLLEKLNAGNYQAFSVFYSRYWENIFIYVQRIVNNENESKDIVQDTFLTIWNLQGKLNHVESFKAYSLTIARNRALRYLRDSKHKTELLDDFISFLRDHEPSALDQLIKDELALFVEIQVAKMPDRMRQTYKRSREEGLSNKEIALLMEVSDQTVKKQIQYSLKYLRHTLSKLQGIILFLFSI